MSNRRYLTLLKRILPLGILLLAFFIQMQYLAELRQQFPNGFAQPFCGVDAQAHRHYRKAITTLMDSRDIFERLK